MAEKLQLCWLGLGNMGRGMCKNLVEKGNLSKPLILYNRTQKRADDLAATLEDGAKVASTIAEAVQPSDIVFICVGDDAAVQAIVDEAIQSGSMNGKLFVDCSTILPDTSNALEEELVKAGAHFVAMPVFGAPAMADAGQLVCVIAGGQGWDDVDKVLPFTKGVMGRAVINMAGQKPGKALKLKLIGNTFILQMIEALSEGLVLAEKSDLGTENLNDFIELMFPGPYAAYSKRMRTGDYYRREEPLFAVDLARKDAGHAMKLAAEAGMQLKAVEVADAHLQMVKEHAGEKGDIAGIYGAVRKEAGLKFELQ